MKLKKYRVNTQDSVGEVSVKLARHLQGNRGEPRNSLQARSQGHRQGPG